MAQTRNERCQTKNKLPTFSINNNDGSCSPWLSIDGDAISNRSRRLFSSRAYDSTDWRAVKENGWNVNPH